MTADPFHLSHTGWIIDFLARNRLPAIYVMKKNVAAGGLMAYGPSLTDLYRRAAGYVHKMLQGTKPADSIDTEVLNGDHLKPHHRAGARQTGGRSLFCKHLRSEFQRARK